MGWGQSRFATTFPGYPFTAPRPSTRKLQAKIPPPTISLQEAGVPFREKEQHEPVAINSKQDLRYIPLRCEREFAKLLLEHNPRLGIIYQPERFEYKKENEKMVGTIPDFKLTNPINGRVIYVEITLDRLNGTDPKAREKMIMKASLEGEEEKNDREEPSPKTTYVVLYRHNLENIQRMHPDYNWFS